ncbi:MAG: RNA-binding S4 domain-containing protein [Crocinitomicaceae bacterium]|nr:RNA-binding S4 domain-containing protein [Crocinitomicaceae bacterium]
MEILTIHTPYIQLNQALKLMGWVESGSMANEVIDAELVQVNGTIELRKRNKVYPDSVIEFEGQKAKVKAA